MQTPQLPRLTKVSAATKKKKILLLSDDLRLHSGIATMSKEFVIGTAHVFDWVQLGAAIKHPDVGKVLDLSESIRTQYNIPDANVRVYPTDGYGNAALLREIMRIEKPDAIIHFTDPRFWTWLYEIEHEIRQRVPLIYYNIWDDLPYPFWNEDAYESCDMLLNISKQTQNIVKNVLRRYPKEEWAVQYVPHGVNEASFYPLTPEHEDWNDYLKFKRDLQETNNIDFIVFWNNRNIRRKQPGDVILSFKHFCDSLPKDKADRCALFMHTQPVDNNGTNLYEVKDVLCPDYKVFFSDKPVETRVLNMYYNIADVTLNIASNEGFGISGIESLMAGTPIINNVTGGLQDHMRFEDENGKWIEFDADFPSNHTGRYKKHGIWAKPVFPSNRSLQGSVPTPYIFDDRVNFTDVADAIMYWYNLSADTRKSYGQMGTEWVKSSESMMSSKHMCDNFIKHINICFERWTPRKRFDMYKVEAPIRAQKTGVII